MIPGHMRSHDRLLLSPSAAPAAWANGMDDEMRLWLVGKVETHALFGERVAILSQKGDWLLVAAVDEQTIRNYQGYPGWLPTSRVHQNREFLEEQLVRPTITVTAVTTDLYRDQRNNKTAFELSYQTRLPLLAANENNVLVGLPDGSSGYLAREAVSLSARSFFSTNNLIKEAQRFLGLRYIWGGTSAYGFDCSGFVLRIYQSQGISNLPGRRRTIWWGNACCHE